jgi:hypothetical protein
MRILSLLLVLLRLQLPSPASVDGVVIDFQTKQPLAGATVMMQDRSASGGKMITVTGNDGRFAFRNLPPGPYVIEGSRSGYVSEMTGSPLVNPRNFSPDPLAPRFAPMVQELTPGQVLSGLRVVLTPGGVISGRLTSERGEVVAGAVVQAHKTTHRNGMRERTLVQSVVSNDLGEYRFFMLKPAQYSVSLIPPRLVISNVNTQSFSIPLFYPGTIDPKAATVLELHVGETIESVNFTSIPTKNRRIAGGVQGNGSDGVDVLLSPVNGNTNLKVSILKDTPNPTFQFSDIVPGAYTLVARTKDMRSELPLDVRNADMLGTRITLSGGLRIPSRARIEGHPPGNDPALENIYFNVRPDVPVPGLEPELYSPFADGRFSLEVLKRDYWIDITRTEDYYIKSITLDGFDVLNQGLHATSSVEGPMEIVLDTRFGEVHGSAAAPHVTVVLVPDVTRRNQRPLYRSFRTGNGVFHFEKVPPGDYKLFAWSEDTIDNGGPWLDPEHLRKYEDRATPVRIQGDMKTILDRPIPVF